MNEIVLLKEKIANASVDELGIFFSLVRQINSFRSWMKIIVKLKDDQNDIEKYKDYFEIITLEIALFYNGLRHFLGELLPRIKKEYISNENGNLIQEYTERISENSNDIFMKIAKIIRDKIHFHFDYEIISSQIENGNQENDIILGVVDGKRICDCTYFEPYSFIFSYLANHCNIDLDNIDKIKWITDKGLEEISRYCTLLEQLTNKYLRKYGILR